MQVFSERAHAFPDEGQKVAKSILSFFSGFEAFALPPPTGDPEVQRRLHDDKSRVNPSFLRSLDAFRRLVRGILGPKRSFNEGEVVTGEGIYRLLLWKKSSTLL